MKFLIFLILVFFSFQSNAAPYYTALGKVYYLKENTNKFSITQTLMENNLKAIAENNPSASYKYGLSLMQRDNFKDAFTYFAKACDMQNAFACNNAGFIKHHNLEKLKKPDITNALLYYEKARDLKNNYSFFNLGRYYLKTNNFMMSYLYFELSYPKFKDTLTKQIIKNNQARIYNKLHDLERSYLKKYYPENLATFATSNITKNKKIIKEIKLPPKNGKIEENNKLIQYNNIDDKNKKAIMIDWDIIKSNYISIPIPLETEDVFSKKNINSLTYRYNIPATITLSLTEETTKIPVIKGDNIIVYIYKENHEKWDATVITPLLSTSSKTIESGNKNWQIFNITPLKKGTNSIVFFNDDTKKALKLILQVQ